MKLLNLGCGHTFHPAWVNVDMVSYLPDVQVCDIRKKLPYPDAYFDVCYSSHVIEHLKQEEVAPVLAECWRILKPQGIIRIVVPDLESIAREYLKTFEQVESGVMGAEDNYDWMMLELYDQSVRNVGGGEMMRYLSNPALPNKEFVKSRIGTAVDEYPFERLIKRSFWEKIKSKKTAELFQKFRNTFAKHLIAAIAGRETAQAFEEGLFRNSGEIHQWMYDRFSLRRLLKRSGFVDIRVCLADESRIPDFNRYNLDMVDGKVRKPDSLFIEGIKP
jgi:SAM-dependent methyltransferase